ncbi:MAG: hypothetical protein AAF135_15700 [Bacteroidota bacterium]
MKKHIFFSLLILGFLPTILAQTPVIALRSHHGLLTELDLDVIDNVGLDPRTALEFRRKADSLRKIVTYDTLILFPERKAIQVKSTPHFDVVQFIEIENFPIEKFHLYPNMSQRDMYIKYQHKYYQQQQGQYVEVRELQDVKVEDTVSYDGIKESNQKIQEITPPVKATAPPTSKPKKKKKVKDEKASQDVLPITDPDKSTPPSAIIPIENSTLWMTGLFLLGVFAIGVIVWRSAHKAWQSQIIS